MAATSTVALITGVTGQDGSYLAERLLADGHDVHGFVFHADTSAVTPGVTVHLGDITDPEGVRALVRRVSPDLIFNLAGVSSVATSWDDPFGTAQATGVAAVTLLQAAWEEQERSGHEIRVLQASSAEIFGQAGSGLLDEETPVHPVNPYGAAKAFAHHAVGVFRGRGLAASSVILFNHESPRRPPGFVTRKITSGVAAITRGEQSVLTLGNLDAQRDWGWAPDYVDAMVRAVRHDRADDYVVATGIAHSVGDFVAAAFRRVGIEDWAHLVAQDPQFLRPTEAQVLRGDASRARRVLGWEPTVGFDEIVGRMVDADLAGPA